LRPRAHSPIGYGLVPLPHSRPLARESLSVPTFSLAPIRAQARSKGKPNPFAQAFIDYLAPHEGRENIASQGIIPFAAE